jgi:uncharacterized protein (DUF433 family)
LSPIGRVDTIRDMGALKNQKVWRNAESAIVPVVEALFAPGDRFPGFRTNTTFLYKGIGPFPRKSGFKKLHTGAILIESSKKKWAPGAKVTLTWLLPVAIGPVLLRLKEDGAAFTKAGLAHAKKQLLKLVQETLEEADLPESELPEFYRNESYYFAFCREMLVRLGRVSTPGLSSIQIDERGVVWLRGTQVKVIEVAASHLTHGWSAEEIRRQHPGLELPSIYAALAWYYEHSEELDQVLASQLEEAERMRGEQRDSPLQARSKRTGRTA